MNTCPHQQHALDPAIGGAARTGGRTPRRGRLVGVAAVAVASSLLMSVPGHAGSGNRSGGPTCRGVAATHVDEDGGPGNDVIVVTTAGLEVDGWNGDDLICVSSGNTAYGSTIRGGNGRDTVITYSGSNAVYGGDDADSLLSNSTDHLLDGEGGNDTIYMGAHFDLQVYGGTGNDRIMGSPAIDSIFGGDGDDHLIGWDFGDHLYGGDGDDRLEGRGNENTVDDLDGGHGTDTCIDAAAPDTNFVSCEDIVATRDTGGGGSFTG